jgi:hypothetical protein
VQVAPLHRLAAWHHQQRWPAAALLPPLLLLLLLMCPPPWPVRHHWPGQQPPQRLQEQVHKPLRHQQQA